MHFYCERDCQHLQAEDALALARRKACLAAKTIPHPCIEQCHSCGHHEAEAMAHPETDWHDAA